MSIVNYRRRDVYFLNVYYICVIYRFNRNRALQLVSESCRSCPDQKPGELPVVFEWYIELPSILVVLFYCCSCFVGCFSRCMRHVRKYCRSLFWCFVLLGVSELSGRVAACSRCCRGIFWMEKLSWLRLWFRRSMRSFRGFVPKSTRRMLWFLSV